MEAKGRTSTGNPVWVEVINMAYMRGYAPNATETVNMLLDVAIKAVEEQGNVYMLHVDSGVEGIFYVFELVWWHGPTLAYEFQGSTEAVQVKTKF